MNNGIILLLIYFQQLLLLQLKGQFHKLFQEKFLCTLILQEPRPYFKSPLIPILFSKQADRPAQADRGQILYER